MTAYTTTINKFGSLVLSPPPGRNPEELKAFGALKFRKSDQWFMPLRLQDLELMAKAGITVDLDDRIRAELKRRDRLDSYLQDAKDLQKQASHTSWETMMGHQRVGIGFLSSRKRALLAFTPGLGKSATSVIAADILKLQRILVVAPLTLLPTWHREIAQWSTDADSSTFGAKDESTDHRWTITNPDQMNTQRGAALFEQQWDLVIFDESILYKNRKAKRTKQAIALGEKAEYVWLLSGSPVSAYADDLYSQLSVLRPDVFRSYWRFAETWCHLQTTPWATEVIGNRDPEGLRQYLRDLMLSRTPDDVPGLLPETLFETIYVDLTATQTKLLRQIETMVFEDGDGQIQDITAVIAQLTRMAQAVSSPVTLDHKDAGAKYTAVERLLKDEIAQLPAIVWVHYRPTAEMYQQKLTDKGYRVGLIHGGVSSSKRDDVLEAFQSGDLDVLVMQLQTGKFGLSLTEANSVIYSDRSFSYDDWAQSVARVRRLSSKGKVVPTYILHGDWTDRLIDVILNRKLRSVNDLSLSDLREILHGQGSAQ